jgi:hypothetical protein
MRQYRCGVVVAALFSFIPARAADEATARPCDDRCGRERQPRRTRQLSPAGGPGRIRDTQLRVDASEALAAAP